MRWSPALIALMCGAIAHADTTRGDRRVEDWVGVWRGAATWTDCTAPGPDELAIALRWQDLAPVIDGAAIFDGLGELWPEIDEDGVMTATSNDVTIALRPGKRGKVTIKLTTASQCKMIAKLTRDGTGIAACDDVIALASVASSCGDVTVAEEPSAHASAAGALTGKAKKRAAAQCKDDAAELRARLVAAECLPVANDPSLSPACEPTWRLVARIGRCDRLPVETKQMALEGAAQLRRSLRATAGRESAYELAAEQCKAIADDLAVLLELRGCP
jgi:hypothetical protein